MIGRGLHHVTVIATQPARNLAFYRQILGLPLLKRTVTHEDPGAYHLIFGTGDGSPGGSLTFFSWASAPPGGQDLTRAEHVLLGVPPGSLDWWQQRLNGFGVAVRCEQEPLGGAVLTLCDPDGAVLSLIPSPPLGGPPAITAEIGAQHAILGNLGVALSVRASELMTGILERVLGFKKVGGDGAWSRFAAHDGCGGTVLLHRRSGEPRARIGAGAIHHVAFRAADEADQRLMAERLASRFGIVASPVKDRTYFRSIYFRGPDGLLIEIATDGPGLLIDEAPGELGQRLILPPGLGDREAEVLGLLPPLD